MRPEITHNTQNTQSPYDVIVVGAGQSGLAMGYYLQEAGYRFCLLDAAPEPGHSWRQRWDSLMVFTPARYASLPGLRMPDPSHSKRPTKDHVADYMAHYVQTFDLPAHFNSRVTAITRKTSGGFTVEINGEATRTAQQVVIATGPFQQPKIPAAADALAPDVYQIHSSDYRNPAQIPSGDLLIVGGANSGAQIAAELVQTRPVALARHPLGYIPEFFLGEWAWWLIDHTFMHLSVDNPLGRRISRQSEPVFGTNLNALARDHDLTLLPGVQSAADDAVLLEDGRRWPVENIIWATGYRYDYGWLNIPGAVDERGQPRQKRGVTPVPGLYFIGLEWMHTRGSALIGWVERDAAYLIERINAFAERRHSASVSPQRT